MSNKKDQKPRKQVVRGSRAQLPEAPVQRAEMQARREASKMRRKADTPLPVRGVAWMLKMVFKLVAAVMLLTIIGACIGGTALTVFVMKYMDSESGYDLENIETTFTSNIYVTDSEGTDTIVRSLSASGRRDWVDIEDIPEYVQYAIICAEDVDFMDHEGVNWIRTTAAFANLAYQLVTGSETEIFTGGASTITQQLIKNINADFYNRTVSVKIKEILGALNLEKNFTKDQILESYMNYISMGNNNYGFQAGAQYYFGKDVDELSIAEAASLAAVTQSPNTQNPLDGIDENLIRRDWILGTMYDEGYITYEEYQEALAEEMIVINYESDEDEEATDDIFSWFEDALIVEVVEDLMEEYDYTYDTALAKVMGGGLQIYSTWDVDLQADLDAEFENLSNFTSYSSLEDMPDVSMVIMDYDGHIVAMIGNHEAKTTSLCFNPVTQGGLKMGSCMKPITVYAPAWDQDIIYWSQLRTDEPKLSSSGTVTDNPTWPSNYGGSWSYSDITIIKALTSSYNTIPVELEMDLGIEYVQEWLKYTLGLSTIDFTKDFYSMTLGNLYYGTYMDEFTAAYTMFGNGGYYTPSTTYTTVLDATGKVLLQADTVYEQVISTETATIMNEALQDVVDYGTGTAASLDSLGIEVAGKTGTTEDYARSFVGLTAYHVSSVWFGYHDDATKEVDFNTMYSSAAIWQNIMEDLYADYEPADFDDLDYSGVTTKTYCTETGLLAGANCTSTATGYYKTDVSIPTCSAIHGAASTDDEDDE